MYRLFSYQKITCQILYFYYAVHSYFVLLLLSLGRFGINGLPFSCCGFSLFWELIVSSPVITCSPTARPDIISVLIPSEAPVTTSLVWSCPFIPLPHTVFLFLFLFS